MRNLIAIAFLFLGLFVSACSTGPVNMTETECAGDATCPTGTYCDPFARLCGWDCTTDVQCEPGMYCSATHGRCLREETPPPVPDMSPVLEITAGPMEDLTVLAGTTDAELVRFTLVNRSERPIEIAALPTTFDLLTGFGLEGVLGEVKVRNERTRATVEGPINLVGARIDTMTTFMDAFSIQPGEEMILAVRSDLLEGPNTEFDLVIGSEDGTLLSGLRYADTGEAVPTDRIANNFSIVRHINVQSEEMVAPPPPTDVGMVTVSMPESGTVAFIAPSTPSDEVVAHIDLSNGLDRQVSFSPLVVRMTQSDGSVWAPGGWSPLRAIDAMDEHGHWLSGIPGESRCELDGCTFTFAGVTLEAGESMRLSIAIATNGPQNLHFEVGNTEMFEHITYMPGSDVPVERVDGNFAGSFTVIAR